MLADCLLKVKKRIKSCGKRLSRFVVWMFLRIFAYY